MPVSLSIAEFIKLSEAHPVLDVRTPAEFEQGHFPGALNLPLFTNEERKIVGTLYKHEGKQVAILKGLELVGPKLKDIVKATNKFNKGGVFLVHCWRGGMRSSSVALLLETYGYTTYTLKGGYKSFRNHALGTFSKPLNLVILGGRTGSGKTLILKELAKLDQQIIDLEEIARHKGSSFGSLGEEPQPTQEAFENKLAGRLHNMNSEKIIWIEDESRMVGNKVIPEALWLQMRNAKVFYIDIPYEKRVEILINEYGKYSKEELLEATRRIAKRLGGQHLKRAVEAIMQDDAKTACEINLAYYDKAYDHGISKRGPESIIKCNFSAFNPEEIARAILKK